MSLDADVQRLVRALLRTGMDAEGVLDRVIAELAEANSAAMLTTVNKTTSLHPSHHRAPDDASTFLRMPDQTVLRWSVEMIRVPKPLLASALLPPTKETDPCPCCEGSGRSKGGGMRCVDCDATGIRNPALWEKTLAEVHADEAAASAPVVAAPPDDPCEMCLNDPCACRDYEPDYGSYADENDR